MNGPSGNVGEFSELYAFAKIISEGALPVIDGKGAFTGAAIGVQGGMRENSSGHVYIQRSQEDLDVRVDEDQPRRVSLGEVGSLAERLRVEISERNERKVTRQTFWCPSAAPLMSALGLRVLKAASDAKSDLSLEIVDPFSVRGVRMAGYTVKSIMGGQPTLLNAGATVFEYEVSGLSLSQQASLLSEGLSNTELVKRLYATSGVVVSFIKGDAAFAENLAMIDSSFEPIFAEALLVSYYADSRRMSHVFEHRSVLAAASRLVRMANVKRFVVHKAKDFLKQVALGLQPGSQWDGTNEVSGGAIIVDKQGQVCCLCLDRDQDFRDYLYGSTKFDTPSSGRHDVGRLRIEGGRCVLALSAQIRMCSPASGG